MRFLSRCIGVVITLFLLFSLFSPSRADAHGIGGVEPSNSTAHVVSVTPETNDFTITSIENGARVLLTRTGEHTVYVLGIDKEPYIRITKDGTYLNKKSATRLINKSTSTSLSVEELAREYKKTSDDPHMTPVWDHVSDSQTYAWHDHRTHYMGSVPSGATKLGTNLLPLRVDTAEYQAAFSFETKSTSCTYLSFVVVGIFFLSVLGIILYKKNVFLSFMNRIVTASSLSIILLLELAHIIGYMKFAYSSFIAEFTASIYGVFVIALAVASLIKIFLSRHDSWPDALRRHAPLLSVTGFLGITAGTLLEFRSLVDPYPASSFSVAFVRSSVVIVGCLSSLIFALGILHIKNTSSQTTVSQDSRA